MLDRILNAINLILFVAVIACGVEWISRDQQPGPAPRVVVPDTAGLDLTRWGWEVPLEIIQVRKGGKIVSTSAVPGENLVASEIVALARRWGDCEMRVWHSIGQHWAKADGERLDTATGWFGVEVKVHAGSVTLPAG